VSVFQLLAAPLTMPQWTTSLDKWRLSTPVCLLFPIPIASAYSGPEAAGRRQSTVNGGQSRLAVSADVAEPSLLRQLAPVAAVR
jgi:hypothetical protein